MGDIEQVSPQNSTVQAIYEAYERSKQDEGPRFYLGASVIGSECDRFLWYSFRHCCQEKFDGRMLRLFETGDYEEERFLKDLRAIGCTAYGTDPETGKQFEFTDLGGHFMCHLDGAVLGLPEAPKTWHLTEFKTHNDKNFKKLKKEGVRATKPTHFAQCMSGMKLAGLRRALYLAKNKDTDELYAERIHYSAEEANAILERAKRIITAATPPAGIANREDDFRCKFCPAYDLCWGSEYPAVPLPFTSCRQCCHATPTVEEGPGPYTAGWYCERGQMIHLSPEDQLNPCANHLLIPDLVEWATPIEADQTGDYDWIKYQSQDETHFFQGRGQTGVASTETLMTLPRRVIKQGVNIEVLLDYYNPADNEILWAGKRHELQKAADRILGEGFFSQREPMNAKETEAYSIAEYEHGVVAVIHQSGEAALIRGKE